MRRKLTQRQRYEMNRKKKMIIEDNNDSSDYNIPVAGTISGVADGDIADANEDIARIIRHDDADDDDTGCNNINGDNTDVDNINSDNTDAYNTSTDNTDCCPICLDGLNTQKVITLQCGHNIHNDCLYKYNSFQLEDNPLKITFPLNNVRNIANEKYV